MELKSGRASRRLPTCIRSNEVDDSSFSITISGGLVSTSERTCRGGFPVGGTDISCLMIPGSCCPEYRSKAFPIPFSISNTRDVSGWVCDVSCRVGDVSGRAGDVSGRAGDEGAFTGLDGFVVSALSSSKNSGRATADSLDDGRLVWPSVFGDRTGFRVDEEPWTLGCSKVEFNFPCWSMVELGAFRLLALTSPINNFWGMGLSVVLSNPASRGLS